MNIDETRTTLRRAVLALVGSWAITVAIILAILFATRAAVRMWH